MDYRIAPHNDKLIRVLIRYISKFLDSDQYDQLLMTYSNLELLYFSIDRRMMGMKDEVR